MAEFSHSLSALLPVVQTAAKVGSELNTADAAMRSNDRFCAKINKDPLSCLRKIRL